MEINNGRLGYTITLDNKQVQQILAQTRADFARTTDYATAELNKVQSKMSNIAVLGGTFLSVSAAKNFVTELIHVRGEFQQIENAIETITGSQEAMNGLMTEWKDLTLRSPFRLSEIAQSGKQLLAYGIEVEKVTDDIEMLGNIASGVSAPINDIAYLYGTLKTQGRAYQMDINQFTGRGIPIIKELAKQFGVAESEIRNLTEAGKIGFPEVEKALRAMTSEGGQFFNLIGKQATTLTGAVNRLKHEIELMFNDIGTNTEGILSGSINVITHLVESYDSIGKTLGVLIATYGAYKAAVIAVSTINSTHIKASEIANKVKLDELRIVVSETEANLALAKSEYDVITAKVNGAQAAKASAIAKRDELLVSLNAAHAARAEAQAQVVAAEIKYAAYKGSIYVSQEKMALQELETAKTNLNTKTEEVNTISKAHNAAQTKVQTLSKEAQILTTEQSIVAKGVENTQEAVNTAVKNTNDLVTKRLTLSQHWYALKTDFAAKKTAFLNATMLNNPIVVVVAAVGSLVAAYFILRDTTTSAQRAQEAYNKTQEEVKSKLDETKKKADEYINTLKDETATVYQQIQAYQALQLLKLKGIENLTQEQIATMDLTELRKLLNAAYDEKSLTAQENELNTLYKERERLTKEINNRNNDLKGALNAKEITGELIKKLEVVEAQYQKQLELVNKIKTDQQLANAPLRDRAQYWEDEIKKIEDAIEENKRLNSGVKSTNPLIKDNTDAANIFKTVLRSFNITPLLDQLEEAKKQLSAVTSEMSGGLVNKSLSDYNYYDFQTLRDTLEKQKFETPKSEQDTEKYKNLLSLLKSVNKEIDSYNIKEKKAKKPKSPKKADDPVEIFKKQVNGIKEEYDRYVSYMNSGDVVLRESARIINSSLTSKGANYEEYLRNVQKQLANVTNKTKVQIKQLQYVNDELAKVIDYNAFDKYKEGINEQIDSSENLLQVIGLLQEEKQKFANSKDQIEKDKFKFLDEKEIENIKKADDAAKSLIKTLTEEAYPLQAINNNFNNQFSLLKKKVLDAQQEIEKLTNENNSLNPSKPESESIRIKNEETIVNLKKEVLRLQKLIDFNEEKREEATKKTPTDNADYNQLLEQFQDFETKKKNIEEKFESDLETVRKARKKLQDSEELKVNQTKLDKMLAQNTATENEILKQKKNAISKINLEQLQSSDSYIKLLTEDASRMSIETIDKIIADLEKALKDPKIGLEMNAQDIKVIIDQLEKLKSEAIKIRPFKSLQEGWDMFITGASVDDKLKGIDKMNQAFEQIHTIINSTLDIADSVGINVSESTREAVELGAELFDAGSQIAAGITSGNPVQVIQGIAKAAKALVSFGDKKKQRQIKRYQQAIDDLSNSFKNLQYETDKALGGDTYKNQRTMLDNLTKQQEEYRKMIKTEQSRKKTDKGKIKEWEQAIIQLDQSKRDLLDSLAQDILQTNAKDLANTLGDALAEAFGKGEDAAKSFEKVANDVLKNAVLNQLKKKFLEDQLQGALDQLYKDMGADGKGNFNFDGLSKEEQQKFKDEVKKISQNFSGALEMYSDLFKDLELDPNENSLSGAIAGVSEETASLISGQMNAMRLLIVEANKQRDLSNKFLMQQLDRLANIDANTRMMEPLLNKVIDRLDKLGENRSYGF